MNNCNTELLREAAKDAALAAAYDATNADAYAAALMGRDTK